jgi:hypothetical protein
MRAREKPIWFEAHALQRMNQRGISRQQVESAVRNPDVQRPARRPGAIRLERRLSSSRRINVIVEEEKTFIRVVTVWI